MSLSNLIHFVGIPHFTLHWVQNAHFEVHKMGDRSFYGFFSFFHFLFRRVIILIFALFASFSLQLTMSVVDSVPMEDGFVMPAEWAEHKQTWMGFPYVFLFPPISGSVLIAILLRSVPTTGDPRPSPPS